MVSLSTPQFGAATISVLKPNGKYPDRTTERLAPSAADIYAPLQPILHALPDAMTLEFICTGAEFQRTPDGPTQIAKRDMSRIIIKNPGGKTRFFEPNTHPALESKGNRLIPAVNMPKVWGLLIARAVTQMNQ